MTDPRSHHTSADDEALSALLDDALDAEAARSLRERLAADPALAARLAELAGADRAVRSAYSQLPAEPLPARVLELLGAPDAAGRKEPRNVLPLRARRAAAPRVFGIPLAAAAGIALAIGITLGWIGGSRTPAEALAFAAVGDVAPDGDLHRVLEGLPSGTTAPLSRDVSARPQLTFRSVTGAYCRQVELRAAAGRADTLACRHAGGWRVEVAAFVAAAGDGLYRPAAAGSTAVELAVDAALDGQPLDAGAERAAIANGWRTAAN